MTKTLDIRDNATECQATTWPCAPGFSYYTDQLVEIEVTVAVGRADPELEGVPLCTKVEVGFLIPQGAGVTREVP